MSYLVLRDSSEKKKNGWIFPEANQCLGTVVENLFTGDYTLQGYEKEFIIERKGAIAEFSTNINEKRFEDELIRMEEFKWPFLVLEFTMEDVINFPASSTIPKDRWKSLRVTPQFIMKRINEINIAYKTKIIFAGNRGLEFASSLFKRVVELWPK